MRILYIQQHFATARGEAGVRSYNLVRTLVARGHDVTVVCGHNWRDRSLIGDGRGWIREQQMDGFRLVRLGVLYSNHQGFATRIWSFTLFALLACREATRRRADLIFASSAPLTVSLPALWARWLRGTPYVLEIRDLWPDLPVEMGILRNRLLKRFLYSWERLAYRRAWRLVALAPGIRDGILRKARVPPSRVRLVPNGSDTEGLRPLGRLPRRRLPVADRNFVLGYAGTLGLANGLDAVLDAAAVLKGRGRREIVFVLIGDGREKARLERRARSEALDNVCFAPLFSKSEYSQVLGEIDVGLQILRDVRGFHYGTSPHKFFDYLAAGKPVLVNYPGWMSDLVTEHGCGIAVPPGDAEAFADAVERLAVSRDRLDAMGRAARALAESQFSHRTLLAELATFLESPDEPAPGSAPLASVVREER